MGTAFWVSLTQVSDIQQDLELHGLKKHWFWRCTISNFAKNYTDYHFFGKKPQRYTVLKGFYITSRYTVILSYTVWFWPKIRVSKGFAVHSEISYFKILCATYYVFGRNLNSVTFLSVLSIWRPLRLVLKVAIKVRFTISRLNCMLPTA